jgi:hypothetical protein
LENIKLSIVLATRGDYYGGDNVFKTLNLIKAIEKKMDKLKERNYEIVVVDYNVVSHRKMQSYLPVDTHRIRVIEVPHDRLKKFVTPEIPFVEFHAKNIGIRNALGQQILVVNNDVKISKSLLMACLDRPFLTDSFLRADRTDVSFLRYFKIRIVLNSRGGDTMAEQSKHRFWEKGFFKGSHILKTEERFGNFLITPKGGIIDHFMIGAHGNAAGDFICAPKWALQKIKGYQESKYLRFMGDSFLICGFYQVGLRQVLLPGLGKLIHFEHVRPIDHRKDWSEDDWKTFVEEFNYVAVGKKDYKSEEENWGYY